MDVFLSFLVAALVFGFQIYSNFKKEQEKAKRRVPGKQPSRQEKPRIKVVPKIPSVAVNPKPIGAEMPDELINTRLIHKPHQHQFERLAHYTLEVEEVNPYPAHSFDLRDAVIKMAILNRPYADNDH